MCRRKSSHARSIVSNQLSSLVLQGSIKTTALKASELERAFAKLVKASKLENKLLSLRRVNSMMKVEPACRKMLEVVRDNVEGIRRINLPSRLGDGAQMCRVELINKNK